MLRSSRISSTRRRLKGKRKYNHTACAMIAGGNRWWRSLTGGEGMPGHLRCIATVSKLFRSIELALLIPPELSQ